MSDQKEVKLFKLSTGDEILAQDLGKDAEGNLLLGSPARVALIPSPNGKAQLAMPEYMPLKDGDNVSVNPDAIVSTAPVAFDGEIYKIYAQAYLGQQIVTPPKTLLLPH